MKKLISLNCLDFPIQFPSCFHVFGNLCPGYRISGQLSPFKSHQVPCFSCKFSRKHIQHLEKADPNWHVQTFPKQWCKIKNIFVFSFCEEYQLQKNGDLTCTSIPTTNLKSVSRKLIGDGNPNLSFTKMQHIKKFVKWVSQKMVVKAESANLSILNLFNNVFSVKVSNGVNLEETEVDEIDEWAICF